MIHDIDWEDPAARLALIERIGVKAYNDAVKARADAARIATVNGYAIRPVSSRFGRIYAIDGTGKAFATRAQAETFAEGLPPRLNS